ncbi:MAG: hypothetical protein QOI00_2377 [Chloroflexota bacterium]|nr:hypothetical protein [Chloroflexota bacterium]
MIERELDSGGSGSSWPAGTEPPPTATVRIARHGRQTGWLAALLAVFIAIAMAKPWAGGPQPPGPLVQGPFVLPTATPAAVPGPPAAAEALQLQCGEPLGWRVFTHEEFIGRTVRAWRYVEPALAARGPLDPGVPIIQVGPSIEALGYCSSWTRDDRPPADVAVSAWRIDGSDRAGETAVAVPLESLVPEWPTDLGALFSPAAANAPAKGGSGAGARSGAPDASWSLGRYVFAVRADGFERWWAVNISRPGPA